MDLKRPPELWVHCNTYSNSCCGAIRQKGPRPKPNPNPLPGGGGAVTLSILIYTAMARWLPSVQEVSPLQWSLLSMSSSSRSNLPTRKVAHVALSACLSGSLHALLCPCFVHALLCAAHALKFPLGGAGNPLFWPFWQRSLGVWGNHRAPARGSQGGEGVMLRAQGQIRSCWRFFGEGEDPHMPAAHRLHGPEWLDSVAPRLTVVAAHNGRQSHWDGVVGVIQPVSEPGWT